MNFSKHIVNTLLHEPKFWEDIVLNYMREYKETDFSDWKNYRGMYTLLRDRGNTTYYVSNSVISKLSLFHTKKFLTIDGWIIFRKLKDFKKTFIIPTSDGKQVCIRVLKQEGLLYFFQIESTYVGDKSAIKYILLYVNIDTNDICEYMDNQENKELGPFLYSLMCYVLLCENEEVIVTPGKKYGTKKEGNFINTFASNVIVINNTWNITSIRVDGFPVKGHPAIRWVGIGRSECKLVYIQPFQKNGYIRKSGSLLHLNN